METTGTSKRKPVKVIPFGPGEAHLQHTINAKSCYICHKPYDDTMVMLHTKDKDMSAVCPDHAGVIREFVHQYKRVPLGWIKE